MDLLAENTLKDVVEGSSYGWVDGQRTLVIEAMQVYHKTLEREAYKALNSDIVQLKNYILKFKPSVNNYKKSADGYAQFKKDFEEWDKLMRL